MSHAGLGHDAAHALARDEQRVHVLLQQREIRLGIEQLANRSLVQHAVRLRAGCADRRTFARVQRAEVNAGAIDRARHRAAERVDLFREVALADAADRGIAAHLPEGLEVLREQQRARAEPRRGERRFGSGVAAADHDAVVSNGIVHGTPLLNSRFYGEPRGAVPGRRRAQRGRWQVRPA